MGTSSNDSSKSKYSVKSMSLVFIAINCIIVSVLTFALTALAVLTSNYDKWFPLAIVLSIVFFLAGRWLLKTQRSSQINPLK